MTLRGTLPHVSDDAMVVLNGWRRPFTGPASSRGAFKEWMHFCVALPDGGYLLLNLSATDSSGISPRRSPRLIVLAWDGEWNGKLVRYADEEVSAQPGRLDARLGTSSFRWHGGAFDLSFDTGEVAAELRLRPSTPPTVASSVSLDAGRALNWVVVPRLYASGWVRLPSGLHRLDATLAYHDHNWGSFRWGGDLSWEWGFVHSGAAAPRWDLVIARVSDGLGQRSLSQAALLWREGRLARVFQNRELALTASGGSPDLRRPFTVPRVAALLAPGTSCGVPARLRLHAEGLGDTLDLDYRVLDGSRVALPSEVDAFRLVFLNETCGRGEVFGLVAGEPFAFAGPAIMEFVRD